MIGILFATTQEAAPLLAGLHAQPGEKTPFETYEADNVVVVISGMGPNKALAATRQLIQIYHPALVINPGVCGALSTILPIGSLAIGYSATSESAPDQPIALPPPPAPLTALWSTLPHARLISVSRPVFGGPRREQLAPHGDLIDMEGYAIAECCKEANIPCLLIKGITDFADTGDRDRLHANLKQLSEAIANILVTPLRQPSLWHRLHRFTRLEHSVFSLPLLLAGAWLGSPHSPPAITKLLLILAAGIGARSFGMAMNRILDRDLDALNVRTQNRELPSGTLSLFTAYAVAATGLAAYLLACWGLGNVCLYLAPVPIIPLTVYSLLKRFTYLCHFGIGACLALAPAAAYVAVSGTVIATPALWMLAGFTFFWISGFDIIYALQDIDADRRNGVRSLPARLGSAGSQIVAALSHLAAAALAIQLWDQIGRGAVSTCCLAVAIGSMALAYCPRIPLPVRFFPISAIASVAGSCIVLLKDLP